MRGVVGSLMMGLIGFPRCRFREEKSPSPNTLGNEAVPAPLGMARFGMMASCAGAELGEEKSVVQGDFAEVVIAARGAAVARAHVDFEQEGVRIRLEGAALGNVFGGLPVHDLRIVEAGFDQDGGVAFAF